MFRIPEILEDNRWGWTTLYIGDPDEEPLLINPEVKTCVGFLGRKVEDEEKVVATCFLLKLTEDRIAFHYLVTAAHIIENTRNWSKDQTVYIYLNAKGGERFEPIRSHIDHWITHPTDAAIDVAVLPFRAISGLDHASIPLEDVGEVLANPARWPIRIGTDVFIPGLFLRHFGRNRNIPILRTGNVAALPDEPVDIGENPGDRQIKAYLIEAHSVGGLSGSPVFACPMEISRVNNDQRIALQTVHILIGVVSAHWQFDEDRQEANQINSGIAIVSPKDSVIGVLQHPRLIEMREEEKKRRAKGTAPRMDDAGGPTQQSRAKNPKDRISIPIPTERQFLNDLEKATRRRKPA